MDIHSTVVLLIKAETLFIRQNILNERKISSHVTFYEDLQQEGLTNPQCVKPFCHLSVEHDCVWLSAPNTNRNMALLSCSSLLKLFVSKLVPVCDSDRTYAVSLSETLSMEASQVSVLQFDHSVAWFSFSCSQWGSAASCHSGRHIQEGSAANRHIIRTECVLDLGPPALYELCDLGHMESAQVEVM